MRITTRRTPNRTRRSGVAPIYLVTHHTIGGYDSSVSWLCNPAAQASADEVISKDGSRVTNLNPTGDGYYTWEVGNANSLCGAGFELEAMTTSVVFPDSLYATLAARMKARQKQIKDKYGVTIPLKHSTRKGQAGIVSHHQLAQWYGGSDHTDGDIDWAKLDAHLAPAKRKVFIRVRTGRGEHARFQVGGGRHAPKRAAEWIRRKLALGRSKITVTRGK